jgi:hypothetical protein
MKIYATSVWMSVVSASQESGAIYEGWGKRREKDMG